LDSETGLLLILGFKPVPERSKSPAQGEAFFFKFSSSAQARAIARLIAPFVIVAQRIAKPERRGLHGL
jgi:hypothetical protein